MIFLLLRYPAFFEPVYVPLVQQDVTHKKTANAKNSPLPSTINPPLPPIPSRPGGLTIPAAPSLFDPSANPVCTADGPLDFVDAAAAALFDAAMIVLFGGLGS